MPVDNETLRELQTIRRLLTAQLVQGCNKQDALVALERSSVDAPDIARALGTTAATIRSDISRMKRRPARRKET